MRFFFFFPYTKSLFLHVSTYGCAIFSLMVPRLGVAFFFSSCEVAEARSFLGPFTILNFTSLSPTSLFLTLKVLTFLAFAYEQAEPLLGRFPFFDPLPFFISTPPESIPTNPPLFFLGC